LFSDDFCQIRNTELIGNSYFRAMILDEGYIKYDLRWQPADPSPDAYLEGLITWRRRLYRLGLIGYDAEQEVGYGNLSIRHPQQAGHFIISGTQTGGMEELDSSHFATVTGFDMELNRLECEGPIKASSEALTHAAVYGLSQEWGAVIHVHSRFWWEELLNQIPTTRAGIPYGTPEMAREVARLYHDTDLPEGRVFAMAGHEEGLVCFGKTLEEAGWTLLRLTDGGEQA
jgi:L-ribulose-5-phosphate 4-epimerase